MVLNRLVPYQSVPVNQHAESVWDGLNHAVCTHCSVFELDPMVG